MVISTYGADTSPVTVIRTHPAAPRSATPPAPAPPGTRAESAPRRIHPCHPTAAAAPERSSRPPPQPETAPAQSPTSTPVPPPPPRPNLPARRPTPLTSPNP